MWLGRDGARLGEEGNVLRSEGVVDFSDVLEGIECQALVFGGHIAGCSDELGDLWSEIDVLEVTENVHQSDGAAGKCRCL